MTEETKEDEEEKQEVSQEVFDAIKALDIKLEPTKDGNQKLVLDINNFEKELEKLKMGKKEVAYVTCESLGLNCLMESSTTPSTELIEHVKFHMIDLIGKLPTKSPLSMGIM